MRNGALPVASATSRKNRTKHRWNRLPKPPSSSHGISRPEPEAIEVQYNPTELSYDKSAQFAEIAIPGLDAPLQQFVRGQTEKLTLELFFDTTDQGMGKGATSVTTLTDRIYQLVKIEPTRHAPPICTFVWNDQFPGSSLGRRRRASGNQRRNGFTCVVESVKQKFTLFSPEGVPLRATLDGGAARIQDAR